MTGSPALFVDRGPCPLCGGTRFDVVHDFDQIPVRRCIDCRFLHSARIMTEEGTRRYYREVFGSVFHRQGQRINAAVNLRAVRQLLDLKTAGRILDVGTGYGFLLAHLAGLGVRPTGVEPSVAESAYARDKLGLDVRTGLLAQVELPRGAFDAVMSFEVIEHVPEPVPFVAELAAQVRPGGWVLINTDNFESPVVHDMGARFPKWIPHTHVNHFGPATLRACIERVPGLRVAKVLSYTPWENELRAWMMRGKPKPPASQCWKLEEHMAAEMGRGYPMFPLRLMAARAWSHLSLSENDLGSMIYMLAKKA